MTGLVRRLEWGNNEGIKGAEERGENQKPMLGRKEKKTFKPSHYLDQVVKIQRQKMFFQFSFEAFNDLFFVGLDAMAGA